MVEIVASNAYQRLKDISVGAVKINAAVCYWTMLPTELGADFLSALKHPDSCLVVDIHAPTSIDSLAKFKSQSANIYLYLFQIVGKTEVPDSKGIPDHLMHAKVLIFDYDLDEVKIWVGSHNGTRRALFGLNFERALIVKCKRESDLHQRAIQFVARIKRLSIEFCLSDLDLYRAIQGGRLDDDFVEIEDAQNGPLKVGLNISIFGSEEADYAQLQKVGKSIYLSVTNSATRVENIYKVKVEQSGYLQKKVKKSLVLDRRRFAIKNGSSIPTLGPDMDIPDITYSSNRYFVTLKVEKQIADHDAVEMPDGNFWVDVDEKRYLEVAGQPLEDQAVVTQEDREMGKFKIQGVNLSADNPVFDTPPISEMQRSLKVLTFSERCALPTHPLIRKRLLVKRDEPDTEPKEE